MPTLKFPCGCELFYEEHDGKKKVKVKIDEQTQKFPDCPEAWELIQSGRTKGLWQIESNLGKKWCRRIQPNDIFEQADLISLMRPATLEAFLDDKKNLTEHYAMRKHKEEPVQYIHPVLEPILKDTEGVLIYQEQAMEISRVVAGFNLQEADELRKAAGKKDTKLMAKVKTKFIDGVVKTKVVSKEIGETIFDWIEKSQRYSFNKSHAVSYAVTGYWTAYAKTHGVLNFYKSWLKNANNKQDSFDEISDLVEDARSQGIVVNGPDFRILNQPFIIRNKQIYFGFDSIKGIGESALDRLITQTDELEKSLGKTKDKWTWLEFLLRFSQKVNSVTINSLIDSGALSYMGVSRRRMKYEFEKLEELKEREVEWISNNPGSDFLSSLRKLALVPAGRKFGGCSSGKRVEKVNQIISQLVDPPTTMNDNVSYLVAIEKKLLGLPLTTHTLNDFNTKDFDYTIEDYLASGIKEEICILVEIKSIKKQKIKNGPNAGSDMLILNVADKTGKMDILVFSELMENDLLVESQVLIVTGQKGKNGPGLIAKNFSEISMTNTKKRV